MIRKDTISPIYFPYKNVILLFTGSTILFFKNKKTTPDNKNFLVSALNGATLEQGFHYIKMFPVLPTELTTI
jgi:hypothetical protein